MFLIKELNAVLASPLSTTITSKASKGKGIPLDVSSDKIDPFDVVLIVDKSNSYTPPFLLTLEIFNKNVHNRLVDYGASSNIMPYEFFLKLSISP